MSIVRLQPFYASMKTFHLRQKVWWLIYVAHQCRINWLFALVLSIIIFSLIFSALFKPLSLKPKPSLLASQRLLVLPSQKLRLFRMHCSSCNSTTQKWFQLLLTLWGFSISHNSCSVHLLVQGENWSLCLYITSQDNEVVLCTSLDTFT